VELRRTCEDAPVELLDQIVTTYDHQIKALFEQINL
jgi:hypothetical protein